MLLETGLKVVKCKGCGIVMHAGDFCWMCELKNSGVETVYVNLSKDDKILAWQSFKSDLCFVKLKIDKFLSVVKDQYRGHK